MFVGNDLVFGTVRMHHLQQHGDHFYGYLLAKSIVIQKIGGNIRGRINIGLAVDVSFNKRKLYDGAFGNQTAPSGVIAK